MNGLTIEQLHQRANEVKQDIADLRADGTIGQRELTDVIRNCNKVLKWTDDSNFDMKVYSHLMINYKNFYANSSKMIEMLAAFKNRK